MNRLKVSPVQAHNLINMVNGLFPPENGLHHAFYDKGMVSIPVIDKRITIHWFELCATHLAVYLAKRIWNLDDSNILILGMFQQSNTEHPIDYLYKLYVKHESTILPIRE